MLTKATIKDIQSLQHKKFRDETGLFVAEGPKVVAELLYAEAFEVSAIYALEKWLEQAKTSFSPDVMKSAQLIDEVELNRLSNLNTPNQVVAVFKKRDSITGIQPHGVVLVLDEIRDPGNLGTIIRTADWFGISTIICSENCVDMYNPKVVQSTMASLANVQILYTDLNHWLLNQSGRAIYAATIDGTSLIETDLDPNAILIIGNESNGVREEILQLAGQAISIPKKGKAESLNAAIATSVLLYHFTSRII